MKAPFDLERHRFLAEETFVRPEDHTAALDEIERLEAMSEKEIGLGFREYYEGVMEAGNRKIIEQGQCLTECVRILRNLRPRRGWIEKLIERCGK